MTWVYASCWRMAANISIQVWYMRIWESKFFRVVIILKWSVSYSRKLQILVSERVGVKRPYSCQQIFGLDVVWCEWIWQRLVQYGCDVVNYQYFSSGWILNHAPDALNLSKGFSLWVLCGRKDSNTAPFSFARISTLTRKIWLMTDH
jgi:hypothetical protein